MLKKSLLNILLTKPSRKYKHKEISYNVFYDD